LCLSLNFKEKVKIERKKIKRKEIKRERQKIKREIHRQSMEEGRWTCMFGFEERKIDFDGINSG
jgi:hypothetical protein